MTNQRSERGSILLIFILVLPVLLLVVTYYMQLSLGSFNVARQDQLRTSAQLAADAGADIGVLEIGKDNTWPGTTAETTLQNDGRTRTTYTATVTDTPNKRKTMTVIGRSYSPATATVPDKKVTILVDLRPVTSGTFGIISGQGGLFMSNSSKVVGGDVFINGEVKMSNTAQIGLSTKPVVMKVAHQICPNPATATFPKVCNAGEFGEPISISNSAKIYGTVTATNQVSGAGMSSPGLVPGTVTPLPLPTYDRAGQKAAVTANLTGAAASCSGSQNLIWPANVKITGNVSISNKCTVTVMGDAWITGNLSTSNSSVIKVSDSLGATSPDIMVDGAGGATFSQSSVIGSNNVDTGFKFYTFWSNSSCNPDCVTLTGPSLFNSRGITTINLANSASAPNTVFYAYWSQVSIGNSGEIGAIIGQTIQMTNTGTLTFGAGTEIGGPVTYVVQGYRRS